MAPPTREPPVKLRQVAGGGPVGGELSVAQEGAQEEGAEVQDRQHPQRPTATQQDHPQQGQRIERKEPVQPVARDQGRRAKTIANENRYRASGITHSSGMGRMTVVK